MFHQNFGRIESHWLVWIVCYVFLRLNNFHFHLEWIVFWKQFNYVFLWLWTPYILSLSLIVVKCVSSHKLGTDEQFLALCAWRNCLLLSRWQLTDWWRWYMYIHTYIYMCVHICVLRIQWIDFRFICRSVRIYNYYHIILTFVLIFLLNRMTDDDPLGRNRFQ